MMHNYLIFNLAIAISFILVQIFTKVVRSSYRQALQFSRYLLLFIVILFMAMPFLTSWLPMPHSNFELGPFMRTVSDNLISANHPVSQEMIKGRQTVSPLSWMLIIYVVLISGISVFFIKYIKNMMSLQKIYKTSFVLRKIHNIAFLINKNIDVPFCWSFFHKQVIVMPAHYLENAAEMKLALQHECQHIRQGDTHWLHILSLINAICFWNPFIKLWMRKLDALQEFSCDEAMFVRKKTSPVAYAQCLLNAVAGFVPQNALGIRGLSQSVLYRRITMVLTEKRVKAKKWSLISLYVVASLFASTVAYAVNGQKNVTPLTTTQVQKLIDQSHFDPSFQISATPEVVSELNHIRTSPRAMEFVTGSLDRMKTYQGFIKQQLTKNNMPHELLAIPFVESGYQPLDPDINPVQAAGIWQIIPQTAQKYGLVVTDGRDDRMDTALSTQGALSYLTKLHNQFNNWGLAVISYEIGENQVENLVQHTGSQDVWTIAHSADAPKDLDKFVATFDAALIVMKNPEVLK